MSNARVRAAVTVANAALFAAACLPSQAMAADMYDPSPVREAVMAARADGWTGFSLGGGVGGAIVDYGIGAAGTFDADTTTPATVDSIDLSGDDSQEALFGAAQVGYDHRLSAGFVFGVFADIDFGDGNAGRFSATAGLPASGGGGDLLTVSGRTEVENLFTLGGRLGFLASPSVLVYGLLGWTHADLSVNGAYSTNIGAGAPIAFSEDQGLDAVTVGAGIETLLTPGFSVKFEYRYTDLGDLSVGTSLATLAGVNSDGASRLDLESHIQAARVVLIWRPGL